MEHTRIYLVENEQTIGNFKIKTRIGLAKEGLWQSVVSDIFTFFMILLSFGVNAYYIHSKLVSILLLFMFIFMSTEKHKVLSKNEFLELVNKELK